MFLWYRSNFDGSATVFEDSRAIRARIDAGKPGWWFGSAEGAIIHGGVRATAYTRRTEQTYDTRAWLFEGRKVPTGEITTTTITAERN